MEEHSDVRIERLTTGLEDEWRAFTSTHELATPFHSLAWKRALESVFGYAPRHSLIYDSKDSNVIGLFACFELPEPFGRTISIPFCEYCMPLFREGIEAHEGIQTTKRQAGRFETLLLKDRWRAELSGYHSNGFGAVETGVTFRLPLEAEFETIWSDVYESNLRQNIRRAESDGILIEQTRNVDSFYQLHLATMKRLGSPPFPKRFFQEVIAEFGEDATLLMAKTDDGTPAAGLLSFDAGQTRHLWANVSKQAYWESRPNDFLYNEAVVDACESGLKIVDFGRTPPSSGVYDFKRQFGAAERSLVSFVHPPHHASRADISTYRNIQRMTEFMTPVVSHRKVGPALRKWLHP